MVEHLTFGDANFLDPTEMAVFIHTLRLPAYHSMRYLADTCMSFNGPGLLVPHELFSLGLFFQNSYIGFVAKIMPRLAFAFYLADMPSSTNIDALNYFYQQFGRAQYSIFTTDALMPFFRDTFAFAFSLDGLSLTFICLTTFITFLCVCVS